MDLMPYAFPTATGQPKVAKRVGTDHIAAATIDIACL